MTKNEIEDRLEFVHNGHFWRPPTTGEYGADNYLGERYAQELLQLGQDEGREAVRFAFKQMLIDMNPECYRGVAVGFADALAKQLF